MPKNSDTKPYQPFPVKVKALANKKIVAISCGETHTLSLTDSGHLYSFGGNTCGQLGQYTPLPGTSPITTDYNGDRKGTSAEDFNIVFPKPHTHGR